MAMLIPVLETFAAGGEPSAQALMELRADYMLPLVREKKVRGEWQFISGKRGDEGDEHAVRELLKKIYFIARKALGATAHESDREASCRAYVAKAFRNETTEQWRKEMRRQLRPKQSADGDDQPADEPSPEASVPPMDVLPVESGEHYGPAWIQKLSEETQFQVPMPATARNHLRSQDLGRGKTILRTALEFVPWRPDGFVLEQWAEVSTIPLQTAGDHLKKLGFVRKPAPDAWWQSYCRAHELDRADQLQVVLWKRRTFLPWKPEMVRPTTLEGMQP